MTLESLEELHLERGERSGVSVVVAIHSTQLGPALGGVRIWEYDAVEDGVADAIRLARAMTLKAAVADFELGGGKGVICAPPGGFDGHAQRAAALRDFGDVVASLRHRYVAAEDVGTGPADMELIAERTPHVLGRPGSRGGSGDPSPATAIGVRAAMRACAQRIFGRSDLAGLRIVVIGLGHVGEALARLLREAGAELVVTDIDDAKRAFAERIGAEWIAPQEAATAPCDVLAPCALGGTVDRRNVDHLACRVVCGSANNVLATDALAERLRTRGILYAPDYVANAGGLAQVYSELKGHPPEHGRALACGIGEVLARILEAAEAEGVTPLRVAGELARRRLTCAGRVDDTASGQHRRTRQRRARGGTGRARATANA